LQGKTAQVVLVKLINIILPRLSLLKVKILACIGREHRIHVLLIEAYVEATVIDNLPTRLINHIVVSTRLPLLVHRPVVHVDVDLFFILLVLVDGGVVDRMVIAYIVLLQFINFIFILVHCKRMIDHFNNIVVCVIKGILKMVCVVVRAQILKQEKQTLSKVDSHNRKEIRAKLQLTSIFAKVAPLSVQKCLVI
jgi:hypothetical protein